jgi:hypothetical protein
MQVKKIFDRCAHSTLSLIMTTQLKLLSRLKKECKSDAVKFQGSVKSIKFDEVLEQTEFETLFGGKGRLVQPTPQNKPKSIVTIIELVR